MIKTKANIILIGFMASGKSIIAQRLANILGFPLFDLDELIKQQENMSIEEIFTHKGEDYFRSLEYKMILQVKDNERSIIVTGGGSPTLFANAKILSSMGYIFFLDANFALIKERLKKSQHRPLGDIINNLHKVKELYIYRRPIYQNLGYNIDANNKSIDNIAQEIVDRYNSLNSISDINKIIINNADYKYNIFCQKKSINNIANILVSLGLKSYRPIIITSDRLSAVLKDYIDIINNSLAIKVSIVIFSDGEKYKNLDSIKVIHDQMFKLGLTRKTVVLALGGGNVGDVAGLAAALYMRGLPYIQIPSTLLAMVDASIGGKTGVDNAWGKNLLGLFYHPQAVVIDPDILGTLSKEDFASGMAETIKHAIIGDKNLFFALKETMPIHDIIMRSIKVKADIIFLDPKENNIRAYLNLGHTYAHAIEKVSDYQIKHGHAVAIGLMMAVNLSKRLGYLQEDITKDLQALLRQYHLPYEMPTLNKEDLLLAMKQDKKRDDRGIRFILPVKLGHVTIKYVEEKDIF